MVILDFGIFFEKKFKKIKNKKKKTKVRKQIQKIINFPEVGKPMRNFRKETREVYIPPFRLSYLYLKEENKIVILDLYHKDEQ